MKDTPGKVLICILLPLLSVNIVSIFTASLTNTIYSHSIGAEAFTITALVSTLISALQNVVGGVVSAAWIRTAPSFQQQDRRHAENSAVNAVYAVTLVAVAASGLLLALTDPLLQALHIPAEIYGAARQYYLVYISSYLLVSLSSYFLSVVNGICGSMGIFWANLFSSISSALMAFLLLQLLKLGIPGLALVGAGAAVLLLLFTSYLLRKKNLHFSPDKKRYKPDPALIVGIIKYGLLLSLQSLLCSAGYLAVSIQTNRFLPLDYITVLSVSLPLTVVMNAFSSACAVFIPPNYSAGKKKRVFKFLKLATACCVGYGVFCFVAFALLGKWYYSSLFESESIIAYGAQYWRIYGFGLIFVAFIFVVRIFLEAAGEAKLSLFAGVSELCGNLICAFYLIPRFGVVGRSLAYPLGWILAVAYLLIVCICLRKKLFEETPLLNINNN